MAWNLGGLLRWTDGAPGKPELPRRNFRADIQAAAGDPKVALLKGDAFVRDESYFSVRLVEMRLASAGNYIANFLPMCSCFLRYTYGDAQREVPFTIGYDLIRAQLERDKASTGARTIEFHDVYIVRNAPVKADGLLMYTALCQVVDTKFARSMLDLLADAAGTIGGPAAGTVARTGVDMTKRLATLLGADGVHTRFGMYDGDALRTSGYRVFAGAGEGALDASELAIEQGQLVRESTGRKTPIDDADYLVLALEQRATLLEPGALPDSTLPFYETWVKVKKSLIADGLEAADKEYKKLIMDITGSPALTETDSMALMIAYRGQIEEWKKLKSSVTSLKGSDAPDITTVLDTRAADRAARLSRSTRTLVESASGLIRGRPSTRAASAEAALDDSALHAKAALAHRTLATAGASVGSARAELAGAALSTPL
jgi:hypothetical protein